MCRVLRADDAGSEQARQRTLANLGRAGDEVGVGDPIVGQRGAADSHRGPIANVCTKWVRLAE